MSIAELLDSLSVTVSLPGAKCKGRTELFDAVVAGRALPRTQVMRARRDALELCRACPVLTDCRRWLDTLPPDQRPVGVVAGRLNATTPNPGGHFAVPRTPLGRRLRELREERQWRQADVAAAAGTWVSRISQWEVGARAPGPQIMARLADVFGVSVNDLLKT